MRITIILFAVRIWSLPIEISSRETVPNDFTSFTDVIDLTQEHQPFYGEYKNINVKSSKLISLGLVESNPNSRIFDEESLKYYITNNEGDFPSVDVYDFTQSIESVDNEFQTPISPLLQQSNKDGTGSIDAGVSIGFALSAKPKASVTATVSPTTNLGFSFTIKTTSTIKIGGSIGVSSSCSAKEGRSVQQFLAVTTTQLENIKLQKIHWDGSNWVKHPQETISMDVNPVPRILCITI
ncbi:hypothetical protein CLIB1444_02S07118 [[Candida] jaroonii]|uniref:Uncharacterized protein n=1 Tax=[Candida] jaroonii TaxID=467808 RepID=A0ACA9Y3N1_9ASCO|nr:hypothetical protein CLIB1444_02S07118 [[Candida] jaroonii]